MITRIEVSGFKTLENFALDFRPGLNILVGPNGSGKTNLVSFFEFLTNLVEVEASEATSRVGGAGAVFRRRGKDYERMIHVRLVGCTQYPPEHRRRQREKAESEPSFLLYEYGFELTFPETRDAVLFSKQSLKAAEVSDFVSNENHANWQLDIESGLDAEGSTKATVKRIRDSFMDMPMGNTEKRSGKDDVRRLEGYLTALLSDNVSLISVIPRFSFSLWIIAQDLSSGRVYNIIPSRIKLPEDSAKPARIDRDGSGLASTLYAIQRSRYLEDAGPWSIYARVRTRPALGPSALDQLRAYLQVVNSSIEDFYVWNDPFDNQLRVSFKVRSGQYVADMPLALMSDGTLKWVALVTAALVTRSVFSIEEPENYLHPLMQAKLVGILREILFRDDQYRMTLMTTHSETLLNECTPEELVILGLEDGRTKAIRCTNAEEVRQEIQRTGFGLGYYYVTNALQEL